MSARSARSLQIPFYDILCTLQHSVGAYPGETPRLDIPVTSSRLSLSTWVIGPSSVPLSQSYHLGTKNKKPSAYNKYIYTFIYIYYSFIYIYKPGPQPRNSIQKKQVYDWVDHITRFVFRRDTRTPGGVTSNNTANIYPIIPMFDALGGH